MANLLALDANDLTALGGGIVLAIFVVGLVVAYLISALVKKLLVLVVVAVLAFVVWQQRGQVHDRVNKTRCELDATFFGIHVDAPQSVVQACRAKS